MNSYLAFIYMSYLTRYFSKELTFNENNIHPIRISTIGIERSTDGSCKILIILFCKSLEITK